MADQSYFDPEAGEWLWRFVQRERLLERIGSEIICEREKLTNVPTSIYSRDYLIHQAAILFAQIEELTKDSSDED